MTTHLEQYDSLADDEPQAKVALANRWIRSDPLPFYAELRAHRPIFATPGFTLVTRFADVEEVLSRERVFTVRRYAPKMDPIVDGPFMLARDATPINWREKGIMQAVLAPEDLPRVREVAGALADEALDAAAPQGRVELVGTLGRYVPVRLCGDYFGFPGPDLPTMYRWSVTTQTDIFKNLQDDPAVHERSVQSGAEMREYLAGLLDEKRAAAAQDGDADGADVFSRLVRMHFPAELHFDDHRIMANVAGLLIGAGETISQAIVQALEQLLLRPGICAEAAAAARRDDTASFDPYVWEALRFNPINPLVFRVCEADHTLAAGTARETVIPAGTLVFACTPSAMFDEEVVPDADEFRTDRPDFMSMHFGYGHHRCLGRNVAGQVIPEVIRRILLRDNVGLLPGPEGSIDFQGGPFPERFMIAMGAHTEQEASGRAVT